MTTPRIACVIPAFNREATVGRAIESALAQTVAPIDVVVVDDGSRDGTARVAESYGDSVRCLHQANSGGASARNAGAEAACADWVAFLDSDDHWTPRHLEAVVNAIHSTQGRADLYFADLQRTATEGGHRQWEQAHFAIEGPHRFVLDATPWVVRPRIPMMLQGTVFQRERFLAKGGLWAGLARRHDTHGFLVHGIGSPACAVNHVGCVMTADDSTGTRLTAQMDPRSRAYWECSVRVWRDVLRRFKKLDPKRRALLRHRLLVAHLKLAGEDLGGMHIRGLAHLARAFVASPELFVASARGRRPSEEELLPYDETDAHPAVA